MKKRRNSALDGTTILILELGLFLILLLFCTIFALLTKYRLGQTLPTLSSMTGGTAPIFFAGARDIQASPSFATFGSGISGSQEPGSPNASESPDSSHNPDSSGSPNSSHNPDSSGSTGSSHTPDTPGISASDPAALQRAQKLLSSMSLEEKVGQMFIVRFPANQIVETVSIYHPGGYILFARDFKDRSQEQITALLADCQNASSIPLLMAVDEEGGAVNRVSRYSQFRSAPFPSPQELYLKGGLESVRNDTLEKATLLKELGLNVNFAPVADVSVSSDDFIYSRTLGQSASLTAEYVDTVVAAMKEARMGSVLKHFPGYGSNADTHTGIAYDNRSYETFTSSDFLPFEAGIQAGADMVLVSHNVVSSMDGKVPASLSPRVHEILRQHLNFSGVIVTDDLSMEGVRKFSSDAQIAVDAVLAGNDLLCCTDYQVQIPAVLEAVENGTISRERIDESVLRILRLKVSLGLL